MRPDGLLILTVWDFWKRRAALKLILKFICLKLLGKTELDFFDVFVPWKNSRGEIIIERYFHCFRKKELENLIKIANFEIIESWRAGKDPKTNLYIIAKKVS